MKKQNETKNETTKTRKPRAKRVFFLYSEGKGFLAYDDTGYPIFKCDKDIAKFDSKREATYIANMCKKFKLADNIDIMAKVG